MRIVAPDGQPVYLGHLIKDGQEFDAQLDYDTRSYRSLPCGEYVLEIPGSTGGQQTRGGKTLVRGPEEVVFGGRRVAFKVERGSPPVIDLGEIRLEKLER